MSLLLTFKLITMKQMLFALLLTSSLFVSAQQLPQCKATTKAGTQCKHAAQKGSEFCSQHNPNGFKCGALTKSGKPCQMSVKAAGLKCWIHSR